jgi:hypothetical protein
VRSADAIDRMERHEERRAARSHDPWVTWSARVNQGLAIQRKTTKNLAIAIGEHMRDVERDLRKRLDAERDVRIELEREIENLKARIDRMDCHFVMEKRA